jgi:hypothetical protein
MVACWAIAGDETAAALAAAIRAKFRRETVMAVLPCAALRGLMFAGDIFGGFS